MSDEELEAIKKIYGNPEGEILYLDFIKKATPNDDTLTGGNPKTYSETFWQFKGETDLDKLMRKIKIIVKQNRIRLFEFFQDHDSLRKGYVPFMKFKGVLHAQKVLLTDQEYDTLVQAFATPHDKNLIIYRAFEDNVEKIFADKELEKQPTKVFEEFKVPSILDPLDVLNSSEEQKLETCLQRIGLVTKNRRLLIKPYF
jgi:hypothetical protein